MIRPILIDKQSPFLGEECALCQQLLSPGEELIICPEDGTRHHLACWQANGDQCATLGCGGHGLATVWADPTTIFVTAVDLPPDDHTSTNTPSRHQTRATRRRHRNTRQRSCGQNCLLISIAFAIIVLAIGCLGFLAIGNYIVTEILGWQYHTPFTGQIMSANLRQFAPLFLNMILLPSR